MIKRLLLTLGLVLAIASAGHAQGLPYQLDPPAPGATMRVCVFAAGLPNPCPVLASIFNDAAETSPVPNPLLLSGSGNPLFFLSPGAYVIQLTGAVNASIVFVLGGGGSAGTVPFSSVTAGTNTTTLVVGTGGSLSASGTGAINATTVPFSGVSSGTNATATMHVGTGASLDATGSGAIVATNALAVNGNTYPANAALTSGGVVCATSTTVVTTSSALSANRIPKGGGAGVCPSDSSVGDDGSTVTTTEPVVTTSTVSTGNSPPAPTVGTAGGHAYGEGTAPTGLANTDIIYANATNHCASLNNNATEQGCISTASVQLCGTTTTCAKTVQVSPIIVYGTVALSSGTPSTATITALPFTSTSSYVCTGTEQTNQLNNLIKFANASASSTVITGAATVTDVIGYICVGI